MRTYFARLVQGIPLALGAMLTLDAAVLSLNGGDGVVLGMLTGLIGIPLLFATLAQMFSRP